MQYKTHKSFTGLLRSNSLLHNFIARVEDLEAINKLIVSKLEPSLASNCRVANLRDGILILATTSPAWNHKLRFYSLDLLTELRSDPRWSGLKSIEIRVDYLPNTESASPAKLKDKISMSQASGQLLRQLAESVKHPRLANMLQKLGSRGKSK
jgi:hypothetical protein